MNGIGFLKVATASFAALAVLGISEVTFADTVTGKDPITAQDPTPTAQPEESHAATGANLVPGADAVDEIITNANLRALSGSKSRWSMSNSITYDGGTVAQPFGDPRPNIANTSGVSAETDINDQISIKYSINPLNALLFGIGVRKMAPFTGQGPTQAFYDAGGKDVDIFDPSLTYQKIYKFIGVQAVAQVGLTQYTRADIHSSSSTGQNLAEYIGFDQENVYEIGRFSLGLSVGLGFNQPTDPTLDYSRWQWWADPYLEIKITDMFNFRTVADWFNYEYYPISGMTRDTYVESVGIGCSITRDLFIYPNIQFNPNNIVRGATNVGVSMTLNLF